MTASLEAAVLGYPIMGNSEKVEGPTEAPLSGNRRVETAKAVHNRLRSAPGFQRKSSQRRATPIAAGPIQWGRHKLLARVQEDQGLEVGVLRGRHRFI